MTIKTISYSEELDFPFTIYSHSFLLNCIAKYYMQVNICISAVGLNKLEGIGSFSLFFSL
jgi:hypothetical protein